MATGKGSRKLTLRPILGLKDDVPADDPSLIQWISEGVAATHDTDGRNVDYQVNEGAATKVNGYAALTSAAIGTPATCHMLFELDDGTNKDFVGAYAGKIYDMTDGTASEIASSVTFDNVDGPNYDAIQYGSYIVFTDYTAGDTGNVPYKWSNGDARVAHLIDVGGSPTEYKFKYLEEWQQRIIGAYSDQTNGDLEIRWTSALLDFTSDVAFADGNALFKPTVDSITGISKLGTNNLLLYGENSITQILYYPSGTIPFGMFTLVDNEGCASHHSIVNAQGANYFFNRNHGFVRYAGGSSISKKDIISYDIKDIVTGIDERYYDRIIGRYLPFAEQIAWGVPVDGATRPSDIFYYHIPTGNWSRNSMGSIAFPGLDVWKQTVGDYGKLVVGATDGHAYNITGDDFNTGNIDGYRIEPILDFGDPTVQKLVTEMWFGIVAGGNYSLDVSYRVGDTTKELLAQSWSSLGSLSLNNPDPPCLRDFAINGRLIQFKWGTDAKDEPFTVNRIDIVYDTGNY